MTIEPGLGCRRSCSAKVPPVRGPEITSGESTTNLVTYSITEEVTALRLRRGGQEARRRQASREGAGGHQQCALVRRAPGPGGWQVWSSRRDVGAHEVELDPF